MEERAGGHEAVICFVVNLCYNLIMAVPSYDYVWQQGEDGEINLVYRSGKPAAPVDLTGYELRMDIRNATGDLLYTFNSEDIVEVPSVDATGTADNEAVLGADGSINIVVPRTASLGTGPLVGEIGNPLQYDVFLRNAQNRQKKILRGTITLEASQTRWT